MARTIDATTLAQVQGQTIYGIWIIRLDFAGDPVYIHSGLKNLIFAAGYDAALNGLTFQGVGNIGSIDPIVDSIDGSQAINLTLPGVDLSLDYLHQIVNNADLWQRRGAWIFFATTDSDFNLLGKPIRVKTGRMDQLPIIIDPGANTGTLTCTVESLQSYNNEALFTRYSDQHSIDATDTSCKYMANLANQVADIGVHNSNPSGQTPYSGPVLSGVGPPVIGI